MIKYALFGIGSLVTVVAIGKVEINFHSASKVEKSPPPIQVPVVQRPDPKPEWAKSPDCVATVFPGDGSKSYKTRC